MVVGVDVAVVVVVVVVGKATLAVVTVEITQPVIFMLSKLVFLLLFTVEI